MSLCVGSPLYIISKLRPTIPCMILLKRIIRLVDLVAEDNAIEDTIYHMTRALDAERVDLDRYLKSIRSLAREQYMKRALIERILQGMGQKQGW